MPNRTRPASRTPQPIQSEVVHDDFLARRVLEIVGVITYTTNDRVMEPPAVDTGPISSNESVCFLTNGQDLLDGNVANEECAVRMPSYRGTPVLVNLDGDAGYSDLPRRPCAGMAKHVKFDLLVFNTPGGDPGGHLGKRDDPKPTSFRLQSKQLEAGALPSMYSAPIFPTDDGSAIRGHIQVTEFGPPLSLVTRVSAIRRRILRQLRPGKGTSVLHVIGGRRV
ncbi:MAG: hypothetical protein JWO80_4885 [Bryobacterales bacterium]|nr:hypothetical protein [Bryobacterales bacterium]